MAVTAADTPDEPSIADLIRAFNEFRDQLLAGLAEFQRNLDITADLLSPGRAVEPLPPDLDEKPPMRGFLMEDPE